MDQIDKLFANLDTWRHFPDYQLERRADVFFSLYLPAVLTRKLGMEFRSELIPEFPIHKPTIDKNETDERSYKVDYVALSADGRIAALVELKTDMGSRSEAQDDYLKRARTAGLTSLLGGLKKLFAATTAKRKYYCLLKYLQELGQVEIPSELDVIMKREHLKGASALADAIEVTTKVERCEIVYVQPVGPMVVTFDDFRSVVEDADDEVSRRFAQSLDEWARAEVGRTGR